MNVLRDIGVGCNVTGPQAEKVARFVAKRLRVKLEKVYVKDTARGHAHTGTSSIILPHWLLHRCPKPYIVYYIAHEVAHLYPGTILHEPAFKRVERRALKFFGMGIKYAHAYPRELFTLRDGKPLVIQERRRIERYGKLVTTHDIRRA